MTNTLALGVLAARGEESVNAATFMVTMMNSGSPNVVGMFGSEPSQKLLAQAAASGQVIDGSMMKTTFAWLRPNDLVFNYAVSGWLLGEEPPAFDVLAWNDDAASVPARFSADSTRIALNNSAVTPGGVTSLGTPIDLGKVTCDTFHVFGFTDHITPWRVCYGLTQLLGGEKELALVKSGHIQSFVNPAKTAKYGYWTGPAGGQDPDAWQAGAMGAGGSWWPQWLDWMLARSGEAKEASAELGQPGVPAARPRAGHLRAGVTRSGGPPWRWVRRVRRVWRAAGPAVAAGSAVRLGPPCRWVRRVRAIASPDPIANPGRRWSGPLVPVGRRSGAGGRPHPPGGRRRGPADAHVVGQRHRFEASTWLSFSSSRSRPGSAASSPASSIRKPGVQNPHCSACSSVNASWLHVAPARPIPRCSRRSWPPRWRSAWTGCDLCRTTPREVPYGFATFGSRSLQVGGGALWRASPAGGGGGPAAVRDRVRG